MIRVEETVDSVVNVIFVSMFQLSLLSNFLQTKEPYIPFKLAVIRAVVTPDVTATK